ncbi:hypothetical protein MNV49_005810 [Pseudohyphozyma bogoriensis]|nr:hypothetical protein MNV49_005810 [Pseudohyphozyma bogoriensis]
MSSSPGRPSQRSLYKAAAHAFLVRDYETTATSLDAAFAVSSPPSPDLWLRALEDPTTVTPADLTAVEARRKLDILRITFLATVRSAHDFAPAALPSLPTLSPLLELSPEDLITALWFSLLPPSELPETEILATPNAATLHPSLVTSLTLAALKLAQPNQARAVCEAFFGSISERSEALLFAETESGGEAFRETGLENSIMNLGPKEEKKEGVAAFVAAWIRTHDLYVLHVLPGLGEWEAASDFATSQAVENGGPR